MHFEVVCHIWLTLYKKKKLVSMDGTLDGSWLTGDMAPPVCVSEVILL